MDKSALFGICADVVKSLNEFTVKSAIAVDNDGSRYYDHALTQVEKTKLLDEIEGLSMPARQQTVLETKYKDNRLISILQIPPRKFDEHKVMFGFETIDEARAAYLSNYEAGWQGLGNITAVDIDDFRKWATAKGRRIKPFADYLHDFSTITEDGVNDFEGSKDNNMPVFDVDIAKFSQEIAAWHGRNSGNNVNFADTNTTEYENSRSQARLDNRQTMERNTKSGLLGRTDAGHRVERTLAEFAGGRTPQENSGNKGTEDSAMGSRWDKASALARLKELAQKHGAFIPDILPLTDGKGQFDSGTENRVWISKDGENVIKVNNFLFLNENDLEYKYIRDFDYFIDRLNSHNEVFPNAKYKILGVTETPHGVSLVLEQPFIDTNLHPTPEQIDEKLTEMGFTKQVLGAGVNEGLTGWTNGVYEITDTKPANVMVDANGALRFIDTDISSRRFWSESPLNPPQGDFSDNRDNSDLNDAGSEGTLRLQVVDNSENNVNFADTNNNDYGLETSERIRRETNASREENARTADRLGRYRQASVGGRGENITTRQESDLREYAQENGIWLNAEDIANNSVRQFRSGREADVYLNPDGQTVTKIVNYSRYSETPLDFIDNRILLFNELFPETAYTIVGFTETNNGFSFVVEQPYIQGRLLNTVATMDIVNDSQSFTTAQNRVSDYMRERFGAEKIGLDAYGVGDITIQDLHLRNVIEGVDGNLYVIDAVTSENLATANDFTSPDSDLRLQVSPVAQETRVPDKPPVRKEGQSFIDWIREVSAWNKKKQREAAVAAIRHELSQNPLALSTPETQEELNKGLNTFSQRAITAWQDRFFPVKRFQDMLRRMGVEISELNDFWLRSTHVPGSVDAALRTYEEHYQARINEIVAKIKDLGFDFRQVENYVMLKSGLERNELMRAADEKAGNPTREDYAGITAIRCTGSRERFLIISAAIQAGFTRIGVHPNFIHLDDSPTHDQRVIWFY